MKLQDLLRHIADNVENGRNECADLFYKGGKFLGGFPDLSQHEHFSLAPRTHEVNGFPVPAPEVSRPSSGSAYYLGNAANADWVSTSRWLHSEFDLRLLRRGSVFLDREAAIANAKAEKGINPDKD